MNKKDKRELVRERLNRALLNLYHNATPSYPDFQNDYEAHIFHDYFSAYACHEIDHIKRGGAWGSEKSMRAYFDSKHKNPKTAAYAFRSYLRRRDFERAKYASYELINRYGNLYTYGRGGRTLAPENLIRLRGASFKINEDAFEDYSYSAVIEAIQILESFNAFVEQWNQSIPEWWKEEKEVLELQKDIDDHDGMSPYNAVVWR